MNTKSSTTSTVPSPFSTGGGGVIFELITAAYYVTCMLTGKYSRGIKSGLIEEVSLQQRCKGHYVDDIIITSSDGDSLYKSFIQVKHKITIGKSKEFKELISQLWTQFNIITNNDSLIIAAGTVCSNTTTDNLVTILERAKKSSTSRSFFKEIKSFKTHQSIVDHIKKGIQFSKKSPPNQEDIFLFLRKLSLVFFDFDNANGRDFTEIKNSLKDNIISSNDESIRIIFDRIFYMCAEYAPHAGEINLRTLYERFDVNELVRLACFTQPVNDIIFLTYLKTKRQINEEVNSKKYIPDIFIEIGDEKETLRMFCFPHLFIDYIISCVSAFDFSGINRLLEMIDEKPVAFHLPKDINNRGFTDKYKALVKSIGDTRSYLADIMHLKGITKHSASGKTYVFNEISHNFKNNISSILNYDFKQINKLIDALKSKIFILKGKAGAGKTNLICDFIDKCIISRNEWALYFSTKEFGFISRNGFNDIVIKKIYGDSDKRSISSIFSEIQTKANDKNKTFLFIFDAINEHNDIALFSKELGEFIETALQYQNIKIILTCRSEYFDERFSAITNSSYADKIFTVDNFHSHYNPQQKQRVFKRYLRYFNIEIEEISDAVYEVLVEDPLMLRFFCETYGSVTATEVNKLPKLHSIRKSNIFGKYIDQKLSSHHFLGKNNGRDKEPISFVEKIISWMISNNQYSDVPVKSLDIPKEVLERIIDEDILLRKDFGAASVFNSGVVINFTYDAFRDYLIADYLCLHIARSNLDSALMTLNSLVEVQRSTSEGLQESIFFCSRKHYNELFTNQLKNLSWYNEVYVEHIFDIDDEYLNDDDEEMIFNIYSGNLDHFIKYVLGLIRRHNENIYKKLSIKTLFFFFDQIDSVAFDNVLKSVFEIQNRHDSEKQIIDLLANYISKLISANSCSDESKLNLTRLMLYLWNLPGSQSNYPARKVFKLVKKLHATSAQQLYDEHLSLDRKGANNAQ